MDNHQELNAQTVETKDKVSGLASQADRKSSLFEFIINFDYYASFIEVN